MFWFNLFTIAAIISGIIFMIVFCLWVIGIDILNINMWIAMLIVGFITIGLFFGMLAIKNANTTIDTEVVEMEVTKCDMTEDSCYITVGDEYMIRISRQEYARLNVGDIVLVEVTKSTFNRKTKIETRLKG